MNKKIYDYLNEIAHRSEIISQKRKFIREQTDKYEQAIALPTQSIKRQQNEIEKIKETEVLAEVKEIANQLTKRWGSSSDLEISFETNLAHIHGNQSEVNNFINYIKSNYMFMKPLLISIDIFAQHKANEQFKSAILMTLIRPNAIQADGKTLFEHLTLTSTKNDENDNRYDLNVEVDDISQLILPFKLNNLIKQTADSVVPVNETASAILDAAEIYRQKQLDSAEM